MEFFSIYLAGNIQKGHEKESQVFWTEEDREFLQQRLDPIKLSFLNPAFRTDDLSDQLSVFGRDMTQVFCSDLIFVDARERRGLGVGAEMLWAKMNRIPLLILSPHGSHYRKDEIELLGERVCDWVHPFIDSLGDHLVENLQEAADWIQNLINGEIKEIKGPDFITHAMSHYQKSQFKKDLPMIELAMVNKKIERLIEVCEM